MAATPLTPPLTPTDLSIVSTQPTRSDISGKYSNPELEIQEAVRKGKVTRVDRLLKADLTGTLINVVDASGRTLVDIVISCGCPTGQSQVQLVEKLMKRGVKFTMVTDKRLKKVYDEVRRAIDYTIQRRRSSASSTQSGAR